MNKVVAGVHDGGELLRVEDIREPRHELRAPDAP
jgi:hypothetical protein